MSDDASGRPATGGSSDGSGDPATDGEPGPTAESATNESPEDVDSPDAPTDSDRTAQTDDEGRTGDSAGDASADGGDEGEGGDPRARDVVVPERVYKSVTVFSTLFAVVTVVGGFIVLDVATQRASVSLSEADPVLALAGLGLIAFGSVTYAFSTRFKAAGMENAKDDTAEASDNG